MDKDIMQPERLQTLKKEQDNGLSTDDEQLKAAAAPFIDSDETLLSDFVTCNYIRGYN